MSYSEDEEEKETLLELVDGINIVLESLQNDNTADAKRRLKFILDDLCKEKRLQIINQTKFNISVQCRKCLSYDCKVSSSFTIARIRCKHCGEKTYIR